MRGLIGIGPSMVTVPFMIALVLAIAWIDFGRPRHVLTWATGFALIGCAWILMMIARAQGEGGILLPFVTLALLGIGVGLNALGFGQRSGRAASWRVITIMVGVQMLATILLLRVSGSVDVAALALYLLVAMTSWSASRTLIGRRRSERAAERLALYWLRSVTLIGLALLAYGVASLGDGPDHSAIGYLIVLAPLLPGLLTGVGLFALFLLTADLADQSRRLAGTDMLTGLLNRRGFQDAAGALLESAERNQRNVCLAMIDIDHFKEVNDRFGHLAGDEVLRRFAACLADRAHSRDIVARVGGEEFALVLADRDCASAEQILQTLRETVAQCPLDLPGDHRVTASFGLAPLRRPHDLSALFAEADRALYRAKAAGRNRIVIAS